MAGTVLGKRSRQAIDEEVDLIQPTKRRITRHSTPQIFEDAEAQCSIRAKRQTVQRPSQPVTKRNAASKRIVENEVVIKLVDSNESTQDCIPTSVEVDEKENVPPISFSTPTAVRFKDAFAKTVPSTPRHRVRLAGSLLTPRSNRTSSAPRSQSVYAAARQLFTQACNPSRLVGRDEERQQLTTFISNAIKTGKGGCTYISGPPGTGKSALVQEIFQEFATYDNLQISTVNCVAHKSSFEVLAKLGGDFGVAGGSNRKVLKDNLGKVFCNSINGMRLVLLDEMDSLLDADCEVLYSIFESALHHSSSLILIGIANALDLTDRFLPRLKMRNLKPMLLPFLPYNATQIAAVITDKLRSLLPAKTSAAADFVPFVHPTAIQLSGKKIASQTGDLRKAFNLIRRAIDQIEQETSRKLAAEQAETPTKSPLSGLANIGGNMPPTPPKLSPSKPDLPDARQRSALARLTVETAPRATIAHIARLASNIFNNGTLSRLNNLNLQQKAVLCSLVANETRQNKRDPYKTPSKSTTRVPSIKDLYEKYGTLCKRDEGVLQPLKNTEFRDVVASLEILGLVYESGGRNSSILSPTNTPSRAGRNVDDKLVVSAVSEKEMRESLQGPGGDLLQRLFDD